MDYSKFLNGIEEIYAIFGRKAPEERICEVIYKRIKDFSPKFMDYAIRHFENQESLPRNMGYYFRQILWPEFLDRNPDLKSKINYNICPKCNPDLPGWRRVWGTELTGWNEVVHVPVDVRCTCGNAKNPRNDPVFTESELIARGFILENPYEHTYPSEPDCWGKGSWDQCTGLEPETSKAHNTYTEKYVEYEF